ncbi:hypothetical protein WKI65_44145 [Streptomyces sp. MS1.AVA.3]|uniref:hypothetical protein n=1 Tax=Streptomyces decoyicus TaxID=249567 RepID=UPI0030C415E5
MSRDQTSTAPAVSTLGLRRRIWLLASYLVALTVLAGCALALLLLQLPFEAADFALGALPVVVAAVSLRGIRYVRRMYSAASKPLLSMNTYFRWWRNERPSEERTASAMEDVDTLGIVLRRKVFGLPAAPADRLEVVLTEAREAVRTHGEEPAAIQEAREDVLRWHDSLA